MECMACPISWKRFSIMPGVSRVGGAPGGVGETKHKHHNWELVATRFLAPAATADGEVTVLE